jgi:hypothetical protein
VVAGEQVHTAVTDDRGGGELVEHPLQARSGCPGFAGPPAGSHYRASSVGGLGEVEQVGSFGLVELEGSSDRVEDGGGGAGEGTTFQFGVVLDAHAGECGDLAATQAGNATVAHIRQDGLQRGEFGSPRDEELTDLGTVVHTDDSTARLAGWGALSIHLSTDTPSGLSCGVS